MKTNLTLVTFNLRMDTRTDGDNYFFNRAPFIFDTLSKEKPDVICFQEATPRILEWLKTNFGGYTIVGSGRGKDLSDEANPIAFRRDKFELFSLDQFWLSPTPHTPGSRYKEQSSCPRICMSALLRVKKSSRLLRIYNTHLDHISERARTLGMKSILARIAADDRDYDAPAFLCGDMNASPAQPCITGAVESGLTDFTARIVKSFHNFGKLPKGSKIDYIFGKGSCKCLSAKVWDMRRDKLYLSDHYPICCEVEVE